jgi:hypothetical protein
MLKKPFNCLPQSFGPLNVLILYASVLELFTALLLGKGSVHGSSDCLGRRGVRWVK